MADTFAVVENEPNVVVVGSDDFGAAFDDAVADKPQVAEEPAAPDAPAAEPTVEEPDATVEEPAPATPQVDYAAQLAALQAENEALRKAQQPAPPQVETQPAAPEIIYTPEQEKALADFQKEWPEVSAGVEVLLQGRLKKAMSEVVQQVFSQLNPALAPVMDYYQTSAADMQYNAIKSAHADYDQIYDDVLAWVDKQPAYIKNALEVVVKEGSAADVVDMISRYKLETGKPTQATQPASAPKVTDLPEKAKQAAKSLGVVSSKRSSVPQSQDPSDFDGAWAEAVNG